MNRTIIAVYGRQSEGKSSTIKLAYQLLTTNYPNAIFDANIDLSGDILTTVTINGIKIGFESQGDPNSRIITENTLRGLADEEHDSQIGSCDIIVCATRTEGKTVKKVDEIADTFGYHTIWISSFWSPTLNTKILNEKAANNIRDLIISLMVGQL